MTEKAKTETKQPDKPAVLDALVAILDGAEALQQALSERGIVKHLVEQNAWLRNIAGSAVRVTVAALLEDGEKVARIKPLIGDQRIIDVARDVGFDLERMVS